MAYIPPAIPIQITTTRKVMVQLPSDDRSFFAEIADITSAINNSEYQRWYEYMPIYIFEIHEFAVWLDINNLPTGVTATELVPGTTKQYLVGWPDAQYAGKTFGFYRVKAIAQDHTHVESEIIDLDKYTTTDVDLLLLDKEDKLPANQTGSVAILQKNALNDTYSWIVFTGITVPTNTGQSYFYKGVAWAVCQDVTVLPIIASSGTIPDPLELQIPLQFSLEGNETYTLEDPTTLKDGYTAAFTHNGADPNPAFLNGHAVDGVVPYQIPNYQSVILGVVNGVWRRLNVI